MSSLYICHVLVCTDCPHKVVPLRVRLDPGDDLHQELPDLVRLGLDVRLVHRRALALRPPRPPQPRRLLRPASRLVRRLLMAPRRAAHAVAAHRMGSAAGPRCRRTPRRRRGSGLAEAAPAHRGPHCRLRHRDWAAEPWALCRTAGPGVGGWAMSWATRPWSGSVRPPFSPGRAPRPRGPPRVPDDTEPATIAHPARPQREKWPVLRVPARWPARASRGRCRWPRKAGQRKTKGSNLPQHPR